MEREREREMIERGGEIEREGRDREIEIKRGERERDPKMSLSPRGSRANFRWLLWKDPFPQNRKCVVRLLIKSSAWIVVCLLGPVHYPGPCSFHTVAQPFSSP